jgi:hypothetical protein
MKTMMTFLNYILSFFRKLPGRRTSDTQKGIALAD